MRRPAGRTLVVAAWTLWVLAVGWFALREVLEFTDRSYVDLRVYRAGVRAWAEGRGPYGGGLVPEGLVFTYPPVALLVLGPLALPPFAAAAALLTLLDAALVGWVCLVLVRRLQITITGRGAVFDALVLTAPALWLEPVRNTVDYGQVNVILLAVVVLDLLVLPERWRGVGTGLAAAVKVTPGIFLLYALAVRAPRIAIRMVGAGVVATLLGTALLPRDSMTFWTELLFDSERVGALWYTSNQSLLGLLARAGGGDGVMVRAVWLLLVAATLVAGYLAVRRCAAAGAAVTAVALTGLVGLLVAPISWSHHWVWILPLALGVWQELRDPAARAAVAVLVLATYAPPQWYLPRGGDQELEWSAWQVLLGGAYALAGAAVLITVVRATGRSSARGHVAAPQPGRVR